MILENDRKDYIDLSIIIPVYNAERFLSRCLDSILCSSNENCFEIILVNDGSKDKSLSVCEKYEAEHENVKVLNKENSGVSEARNKGLSIATGRYIVFVDADDYVVDDYVPNILSAIEEAEKKNCQLIVFDYYKAGFSKKTNLPERINASGRAVSLSVFFDELCRLKHNPPWNKVFLKSIMNDNQIMFPKEIQYGEDVFFLINYSKYIKHVLAAPTAIYCYVDNPSSAVKNVKGQYLYDTISVYCKLIEVYWEEKYREDINNISFSRFYRLSCKILFGDYKRKDEIINCIKRHSLDIEHMHKGLSRKNKMKLYLLLNHHFKIMLMLYTVKRDRLDKY